ncbi:hypothetical protein Enr10x_13310 [Gimesia panareensis]|uniref:Uncharacterized protein n=2 Tax=Gimesia panareensis TaxID=2527978 RepID=A0A517Q346_9PLAN|nr:hypothetical protein Enr10x_13310 [Gimesia panareensis]QDU48968.1 hypothetical protein Pan110_12840 [Gimesia panareensis]
MCSIASHGTARPGFQAEQQLVCLKEIEGTFFGRSPLQAQGKGLQTIV